MCIVSVYINKNLNCHYFKITAQEWDYIQCFLFSFLKDQFSNNVVLVLKLSLIWDRTKIRWNLCKYDKHIQKREEDQVQNSNKKNSKVRKKLLRPKLKNTSAGSTSGWVKSSFHWCNRTMGLSIFVLSSIVICSYLAHFPTTSIKWKLP